MKAEEATRVRWARAKFKELDPILADFEKSYSINGNIYTAIVQLAWEKDVKIDATGLLVNTTTFKNQVMISKTMRFGKACLCWIEETLIYVSDVVRAEE